jgi:DNA-binding LacI/PurR family transcriptional regulator
VLIGVPAVTEGVTCVDLDFDTAAAMCVEHLASLGHREVVLVGEAAEVYRRGSGFANRSLTGFTRRAAELGLSASHHHCDGSPGQVEAPIAAHPGATAFVVHNARALRPFLDALQSRGRDVPRDISVVALAPDGLASASLTTVPLPSEEMGRRAVELLMAKLDGAPDSGATLLTPELLLRGSTAAPPEDRAKRGRGTAARRNVGA